MRQLLDWINDEESIHPVLIAGISQFQLVHIHPFLDGNGRTARLLSTLCLYRSNCDFKQLFNLSEYYDKNRQSYYEAIQNTRVNNMDLTGWLEYFTLGLAGQLTDLESNSRDAAKNQVEKSYEAQSEQQKKSLEFLNDKISDTIKKYIGMSPFADTEKLKNEINYLIKTAF